MLDGILDAIGLEGDQGRRLTVLRALDKFDKFGAEGVRLLLGAGRLDESGGKGDFTKGAELDGETIARVLKIFDADGLAGLREAFGGHAGVDGGLDELSAIESFARTAGYEADRVKIDPSVVRGLEYYTGPVFEAELLFDVVNEKGQKVQFGSVGGGGRYDGLVSRFLSTPVPATGFSIGVSRLQTALKNLGRLEGDKRTGPVVVTVMDRDRMADYQAMATSCARRSTPPASPSCPSRCSKAIRSSSASSCNMPTGAARPSSSSRAATRRRPARSRSRTSRSARSSRPASRTMPSGARCAPGRSSWTRRPRLGRPGDPRARRRGGLTR